MLLNLKMKATELICLSLEIYCRPQVREIPSLVGTNLREHLDRRIINLYNDNIELISHNLCLSTFVVSHMKDTLVLCMCRKGVILLYMYM